jgi:hypothetical protein
MNSSALLDALKGCGAELAAGLTDSQLDRAQERFGFLFAPDHRLMLLRDGRHYYGSDLLDWFEHEFQKSKRPIGPIHRRLPFWTSLVDMEWSDPDTE